MSTCGQQRAPKPKQRRPSAERWGFIIMAISFSLGHIAITPGALEALRQEHLMVKDPQLYRVMNRFALADVGHATYCEHCKNPVFDLAVYGADPELRQQARRAGGDVARRGLHLATGAPQGEGRPRPASGPGERGTGRAAPGAAAPHAQPAHPQAVV
jgi:hypothetical protein